MDQNQEYVLSFESFFGHVLTPTDVQKCEEFVSIMGWTFDRAKQFVLETKQ